MKSFRQIVDIIKEIDSLRFDKDVEKELGIDQIGVKIHRNTIPIQELVSYCNKKGISLNWLLTGEGPMLREESGKEIAGRIEGEMFEKKELPVNLDAYTYIPVYNVKAHGGGGAVIGEEKIVDALAFKKSWINQELLANREDLFLIYMEGESMEPTLHPKDILLVDRRDSRFTRESIYVIREGDMLLVKRVRQKEMGKVELLSDNPAYPPREIDLTRIAENNFQVIGRVVWIGRRI